MVSRFIIAVIVAGVCIAFPFELGYAQKTHAKGPVTNLPIPRYVSIKASKANIRRGPSLSHRIDWVFQRKGLPVQITAEYGHWRRVQDIDGAGGWVHYALISGARTVMIKNDDVALLSAPGIGESIKAQMQMGVIADLGKCTLKWCYITADGYKGWAEKTALWGVGDDEIRD